MLIIIFKKGKNRYINVQSVVFKLNVCTADNVLTRD